MYKGLKYRLYPTDTQKTLIDKHIGSCRFIYNLALETKISAYLGNKINLTAYDLAKDLPILKKEYEWLKEINAQSLQQSIHNMDIAFKLFFKGSGFPKYKSKNRGKQSFPILQDINLDIKGGVFYIPKFRKKNGIKIVLHREIKGTIKSAVISKTSTGKYFVSILVDTNIELPQKLPINEETTIGIDLGIKSFLVDSNGNEYKNPKYLKNNISKLKYISRKYSKYKGKRTKQQLALQYEKVTNKRKDYLHKISTKLISENQTIAIENLNIKGMVKNHKLAQSIQDASWGMFIEMLKYKAEWNGKNIIEIGRFAPSSKTCSNCGYINKELTLNDREWECKKCYIHHDRDINAAINIKSFALKDKMSGEHTLKNQDELPTLVGVLTPEA